MNKMRSRLALAFVIGCILMLSSVTTVSAQKKAGSAGLDSGSVKITPEFQVADINATIAGDLSAADSNGMYIVRLTDRPIAIYDGGIQGLAPTSAQATGQRRLDTNSSAARAYQGHLQERQQAVLAGAEREFGRSMVPKFQYQHAFNGFAIELTAEEAKKLRMMDGVADVQKERIEHLLTDAGPSWIGAPEIWYNGENSTMGEGVVVAILDTGINHDHPSFAAVGGDGYVHVNPLGAGNYIPGSYCDFDLGPGNGLVNGVSFCNDKLIGAWSFVQEPVTPEDSDGHGSHTASTVAGNVTEAVVEAATVTIQSPVSGVAPHANIIAYDVCIDTCPGSALVAAVNQVLIDAGNLPNGIAALNYSISGGGDPYNDPVELGFLAAVQAGVYVAASAGNAGPGPSTVAHLGPWVSTTAAATHDRTYPKVLHDLSSDGHGKRGKPRDLRGRGATSGYGPAPIVHAVDYPTSNGSENDDDPGQCLDPFPPGTWNGEIVVCDRGSIARVSKGYNVLMGGAGGFILANLAGNGESTNGDAHFLPAIHVGYKDAEWLRKWLATYGNTMGTIGPFEYGRNPWDGDIMASFSSRGPQTAFDVLKPDIAGPGVDVLAAVNDQEVPLGAVNGNGAPPPWDYLSGTSMSSPHNAGSGALMTAMRPDLTPPEIKSALMMSSENRRMLKEDGVTPADAFDQGAGRLSLGDAKKAHLVLSESTDNFLDANPELGGDPSTLNLASMMNSACVGECSWTRTLTNSEDRPQSWRISTVSPPGVHLGVEISGVPTSPLLLGSDTSLSLGAHESKQITVYADTRTAPQEWQFAQLDLVRTGTKGPALHMPISVLPQTSTAPNLLNKAVDQDTAGPGATLNYEISVVNGPITDTIEIVDVIPAPLQYVPGSAGIVLSGGTEVSPLTVDGNTLTWSGTLDPGLLGLAESPSPFGYFPLASLGVDPFSKPSNPDDGGFIISGLPPFGLDGQTYTSVIWSVNGTVEAGTASGLAASASPDRLPNPDLPNNLIAPFWTDLNLTAETANWYLAVLTAGPDQFTVFEWENVPTFSDPTASYNFQIWMWAGTDLIWFVYDELSSTAIPLTVGVENDTGVRGDSYYYSGGGVPEGTPPVAGTDLLVVATEGGSAVIDFSATLPDCTSDEVIVNEVLLTAGDDSEHAFAATSCDTGKPRVK